MLYHICIFLSLRMITRILSVNANVSVAAVFVACALSLVARVVVLLLRDSILMMRVVMMMTMTMMKMTMMDIMLMTMMKLIVMI